VATLIYGVNLPAAEKPGSGEKIIIVEAGGDVAAPESAAPSKEKSREAKVRKAADGLFEVEIVGEGKAELKGKKSQPVADESAEEHKWVVVGSTNQIQDARYWIGLAANPLTAEQRKELKVKDDLAVR
jgi:hypothetical protein